jgi:hypothetical protein
LFIEESASVRALDFGSFCENLGYGTLDDNVKEIINGLAASEPEGCPRDESIITRLEAIAEFYIPFSKYIVDGENVIDDESAKSRTINSIFYDTLKPVSGSYGYASAVVDVFISFLSASNPFSKHITQEDAISMAIKLSEMVASYDDNIRRSYDAIEAPEKRISFLKGLLLLPDHHYKDFRDIVLKANSFEDLYQHLQQ